jgi:hypothetical protein
MADALLNTSKQAIRTKLLNDLPSADADGVSKLGRMAKSIGLEDDTAIETAVNSRVNALASGATTEELSKLSLAIKNMTAQSITVADTDYLAEGSVNLYYTDSRVDSIITNNLLIDEDDFASDSATKLPSQQSTKAYIASQIATKDNTDEIAEGSTNLYYTDARVDSRIASVGSSVVWNSLTDSLIPAVNSDGTTGIDLGSSSYKFRDLYLSGSTIHLGSAQISASGTGIELPVGSVIQTAAGTPVPVPSKVEDLSNVDILPEDETLSMAVDETDAGHGTSWKWSWNPSTLPYARDTILNQTQGPIPIYKGSTYNIKNFAANTAGGSADQLHKIHHKWLDGAGLQNLTAFSTSTLDTSISFPGVRSGAAMIGQKLDIVVPAVVTAPSLTAPTVSYDVAAGGGVYTFSGSASGNNPSIGPVYEGGTYTFNLDSSVSGHPFYLTNDDGTGFVAGSYVGEYTSGVTGSRNESGTLVWTVPVGAGGTTVYYQCGNHSAMMGSITVKALAVETDADGNYVTYLQHTQEGHKNSVPIKPKPALVNQMCLSFVDGKFIPQDLVDYTEKTASFKSKIEQLAVGQITAKVTAAEISTPTTTAAKIKSDVEFIANLNQQGELQVVTGTARWYAPFALEMQTIKGKLGTAADGVVGVVIKKNGISEKTLAITTGQTSADVSSPTFTMTEGQYLTVDITSIGTTNKGSDLVVQFKYRRT